MNFSLRRSVNKISWEIGHESFPLSPRRPWDQWLWGFMMLYWTGREPADELWSHKELSLELSAFSQVGFLTSSFPFHNVVVSPLFMSWKKFYHEFSKHTCMWQSVVLQKWDMWHSSFLQEYEAPAIDEWKLEVVQSLVLYRWQCLVSSTCIIIARSGRHTLGGHQKGSELCGYNTGCGVLPGINQV